MQHSHSNSLWSQTMFAHSITDPSKAMHNLSQPMLIDYEQTLNQFMHKFNQKKTSLQNEITKKKKKIIPKPK